MYGREGVALKIGEAWGLRFDRSLAHPTEGVWAAITGPGAMSRWFDQTEMPQPPILGGKIRFYHGVTEAESFGEIVALEPPRLIEWLWLSPGSAPSRIRWEIAPEAEGCRLTLRQLVAHPAILARTLAGWHVCLDRLQAILDDIEDPQLRGWPALFEYYAATLPAAGITEPQVGAPPKSPPTS